MEPLPILIVLAIALLLFPLKNATFCVKKVVTICVNFTFYILVTTLRVYVRFCVSCCISGVTHDNYFRRHWRDRLGSREPQVGVCRVSRTFSPRTKTLFFSIFSLWTHFLYSWHLKAFVKVMMTSGICSFWAAENQKFIKQM